jgi:predicted RNA-binding protein YlxR (DUF448 family)
MDEARLIRFVVSPTGDLVPDLSRKLPGRGMWVAADRASIDLAVRKSLFAKGARRKVNSADGLSDLVESLLARRLLDGLGLARRAGHLVLGFEKCLATLRGGRAGWLIEAMDGSADGRRKFLGLMRHIDPPPGLLAIFNSDELGLALGGDNVIHTVFLAGRACDRWALDARRLAGFRPLIPESWREERSN